MNKNLPALIIGLVAVIAIIGGVVLYQNSKPVAAPKSSSNNSAPPIDKMKTAPPGASPAWSRGAPNAVVTLEEFADFECPSCGFFEPTMREIKTVYGDRVRVIFRQYPLTQVHQHAFDAARAAEAAGAQGKFWEMHDLIYDKQKEWSKAADPMAEFTNYAKTLGLNPDKFKTDLTSSAASDRIAADRQRGDYVGIRATPSVFFNGRLLTTDEMQVTKLRGLIENALQGK